MYIVIFDSMASPQKFMIVNFNVRCNLTSQSVGSGYMNLSIYVNIFDKEYI